MSGVMRWFMKGTRVLSQGQPVSEGAFLLVDWRRAISVTSGELGVLTLGTFTVCWGLLAVLLHNHLGSGSGCAP